MPCVCYALSHIISNIHNNPMSQVSPLSTEETQCQDIKEPVENNPAIKMQSGTQSHASTVYPLTHSAIPDKHLYNRGSWNTGPSEMSTS